MSILTEHIANFPPGYYQGTWVDWDEQICGGSFVPTRTVPYNDLSEVPPESMLIPSVVYWDGNELVLIEREKPTFNTIVVTE